jgi:ribosome-binding protein aMBF1 (putative translation factor)
MANNLGEHFRSEREKQAMTLAQLARKVGYKTTTMRKKPEADLTRVRPDRTPGKSVPADPADERTY